MADSEPEVVNADMNQTRRQLNVVSVLLPCRRYRLTCSWTREDPLPALEEQACRLLMIVEGTTARELQEYFGLSKRERDVLIRTLQEKRLVETAESGDLVGSALLQGKAQAGAETAGPSLTTYETREEKPVFDTLTLTMMPRRRYQGGKFGLPEVDSSKGRKDTSMESVKDAFSRQYRLHLENTLSSQREIDVTRLYKIGDARRGQVVQVPIDMEFNGESGKGGDIRITRDAVERVGEVRKRGLSNEIEAEIADFLGTLEVPDPNTTFENFCDEVGDEVLRRYAAGQHFDLGNWMEDRGRRRTGYGNPLTEAMLGPVYLEKNRAEILDRLRKASSESGIAEETETSPFALWMAAQVPLWAANGTDLELFVDRVERRMERLSGKTGRIVGLFPYKESGAAGELKRQFHSRVPNGWGLQGSFIPGRMELFVVPGVLGVAQYHIRPNESSAFTYPVGHITSDPERVRRLEEVLRERVARASDRTLLWSGFGKYEVDEAEIGDEWLGLCQGTSARLADGESVWSRSNRGRRNEAGGTQIVWKKKRPNYRDDEDG